jgi:hemoglobin
MTAVYEKLGGAEAIDALVDNFFVRILGDERIDSFLVGVDIKKQALQLKMFLTYEFGGLVSRSGKSMRAAHQGLVDDLGLSDDHFDAVVENLVVTLSEMDVADDLIAEVAALIEDMRDDVLCR